MLLYLQGTIVVRDGDLGSDRVKIEIDRSGPSDEVVKDVTVNETIFDIGYGRVFVLQLVSGLLLCSFCITVHPSSNVLPWHHKEANCGRTLDFQCTKCSFPR